MTRINLVDPKLLVRQHLIAEYRELPRIYYLVLAAIDRGEDAGTAYALSPGSYTLGTGHCRFFYTRLGWLCDRFDSLVGEMQRRGIKTTYTEAPPQALAIPREWWGPWEPTPACVAINVARINERLRAMGLSSNQIDVF